MLEPELTKQRMLDTHIHLYERDDRRLARKACWMKISVWFIALAIALLVAGNVTSYAIGETP